MGVNRKVKGAISVFMVIVYIWVFILMGILVDGARVRMAEAQAEEIQQLANETMLTYYNRALYEYYDLFGESKIAADSMGSMIQNIMQQSMSLELNGDLKSVMDSKWVFTLSGKSYFDPYDLTVDSISVGSNINLLDKEVFKSQINDAMKYSAPLILVNNFLNLVDSFGAASEGVQAVTECREAVSDLSEQIEAYQDAIGNQRYQLYNFCEDPTKELSSKKHVTTEAFDVFELAEEFDEEAEKAVKNIKNKTGDAANEEENEEKAESEEQQNARKAVDEELDEAYEEYMDKMEQIRTNSAVLLGNIDALLEQGESLKNLIAAKQSELNIKGTNQKSTDVGDIYLDFGTSMNNLQQAVEKYNTALETLRRYVNMIKNGVSVSWESYTMAAQNVLNKLKTDYDAEHRKMTEDSTVEAFVRSLNTQLDNILEDIDGLDRIEVDDSQLKEAEERVKAQTDAAGTPKDSEDQIEDTDRLGRVTTIAETAAEENVNTSRKETYHRKNAEKKAKEMGGSITSLMGTLLGSVGESLMDNLYSDAYILTNFRDYVHTYKMLNEDGSNNSGKDGYDSVANIKFLQGEKSTGLTREQFEKIETTCAETEYVLYGLKDTKQCVAAAYASIYAYRLALDYVSVFLTSDFRDIVMQSAEAAGVFAPAVIALLPFAWAIPQAAIDMQLIMEGKTTPLILTNAQDDWFKNDYSESDKYLAGYSDYLLIMLLMTNGDKKVERMQDIIQMNMRTIDSNFTLENSLVNVYVQSTCSIKYLFMTQAFMPAGTRMDGRYSFDIKTSVSY